MVSYSYTFDKHIKYMTYIQAMLNYMHYRLSVSYTIGQDYLSCHKLVINSQGTSMGFGRLSCMPEPAAKAKLFVTPLVAIQYNLC